MLAALAQVKSVHPQAVAQIMRVHPKDQIACSLHLGVCTHDGRWIECSPWCAGTRGLAQWPLVLDER